MIKKVEELVVGDQIVTATNKQLGTVRNVSRGEKLVGATVGYPRTYPDDAEIMNYLTWDCGDEVFVPVPAQPVATEPDELGNDDRNLADWGTNTPLQ